MLLLIDCGGNDIYRGSYALRPKSPLLHRHRFGGRDIYQSELSRSFGLWDFWTCRLVRPGTGIDTTKGKRVALDIHSAVFLFCTTNPRFNVPTESLCFGASEAGISLILTAVETTVTHLSRLARIWRIRGLGFLGDEAG
jgi:hypothetical protein